MLRIVFNLLTFLGSTALLISAHLSGAWIVTSTAMAEQTWIALLFTFGLLTTILSLFFIGFELASFIHRKPPIIVNKEAVGTKMPTYISKDVSTSLLDTPKDPVTL